jgi:RNA polymerase sigma factor (sigma-70 family)
MPPLPMDASLLDELYRRSNAARWALAPERFAKALEASAAKAFAGREPSASDLEHYLASLRLEELALACACAVGIGTAWDHFVLNYRPVLYRTAEMLDPGGGRELADSIYAELYGLQTDANERGALFRYFHGRSSLATWLRAVLAQRRVDRARAERRMAPMPDNEPLAAEAPPADPDQKRFRALIQTTFGKVVAQLESRDRLRLRYYYAQELTLAETGKLLHEHEATVSRQLARTRKVLRAEVERQLSHEGLSPEQIERCFECATEDVGPLDLDDLLADTAEDARKSGPVVLSKRVKR